VSGARIAGVTRQAYDVLEVDPSASRSQNAPASSGGPSPSRTTISLSQGDNSPVVLGRILTLVGLLALLAQFVAIAVRQRRGSH
jgi:hypothetical protein